MVRRVVGRFPDSSTAASQHMPVLTATRLCKAHLGATSLATRRRSKCCLHHVSRRSLRVRYNGCNTASTRAAALSEPALCSTMQTHTNHKSSNVVRASPIGEGWTSCTLTGAGACVCTARERITQTGSTPNPYAMRRGHHKAVLISIPPCGHLLLPRPPLTPGSQRSVVKRCWDGTGPICFRVLHNKPRRL